MPLAKHLDKLGVVGSFIAAACCLGLPAIISIFAALGLGFLINYAILLPVLLLFLGITLFGLFQGYRRHKRIRPLVVGTVSALAVTVLSSWRSRHRWRTSQSLVWLRLAS